MLESTTISLFFAAKTQRHKVSSKRHNCFSTLCLSWNFCNFFAIFCFISFRCWLNLRNLILIIGTFLFLQILHFDLHSQSINNSELTIYEDSLSDLFNTLAITKSDSEKRAVNNFIINKLLIALESDNSFSYPFDSIKKLGKITSEDNQIRIYTWNVAFSDFSFKYYTIVQIFNEKEKTYNSYLLKDNSDNIENPENANLNADNWYGALYYQIVVSKYKKKKTYILIGWKGFSNFSTKKVIDAMEISKNVELKFAQSVFKINNEKKKRIIFEFSARASMTCHYDQQYNMIIYDHLSPSNSKYAGQYQYYGPDITQDALIFNNGFWTYNPNVDVRNLKPKNKPKNE